VLQNDVLWGISKHATCTLHKGIQVGWKIVLCAVPRVTKELFGSVARESITCDVMKTTAKTIEQLVVKPLGDG
tara:strand:- start:174 stop:392 length:219 start_codon:yes stop_codon:yes gene_type:complete